MGNAELDPIEQPEFVRIAETYAGTIIKAGFGDSAIELPLEDFIDGYGLCPEDSALEDKARAIGYLLLKIEQSGGKITNGDQVTLAQYKANK